MPRKIILSCMLPPGDVCTMTAAIESLHLSYAGEFLTDVRTGHDAIFENNPHITKIRDGDGETLAMHYTDLINQSNQALHPFLHGYTYDLGRKLGLPLELRTNRPHFYLSEEERGWMNQVYEHYTHRPISFWLVNAGIKRDFTLKQWPVEYYQEVIDAFRGRIQFVQIGRQEDDHPELSGVIYLVGQTTTRQLIRLAYHAAGGLGPITFLQHLMAGFEKPYVAIVGGREPVPWVQYPLQTTLHTVGRLPCCRTAACWRSRVVPFHDGTKEDVSLCESPFLGLQRPVGKCMALLQPHDVVRAIELCYDGGLLRY